MPDPYNEPGDPAPVSHTDDWKSAEKEPAAKHTNPAALRKQAQDIDDAHHAESTFHLSEEALARAGIRAPAFRPETDEKTGAHTGNLIARPAAPESHG